MLKWLCFLTPKTSYTVLSCHTCDRVSGVVTTILPLILNCNVMTKWIHLCSHLSQSLLNFSNFSKFSLLYLINGTDAKGDIKHLWASFYPLLSGQISFKNVYYYRRKKCLKLGNFAPFLAHVGDKCHPGIFYIRRVWKKLKNGIVSLNGCV